MSNRFVRVVAAVAFVSVCGVALVAQSLFDRVVGTFPAGQTIQIQLPPTSFWFEHSLDQIASSTHVLMGVESVDDRRAQPTLADPLLILTGRSFREAVDLLVSARPGFVWRADDDIVHLLRAGQDGSVLARSLESFSLDNVTPLEALHQLCEAFQRTPSRGRGITYSGPPPSPVGQHRFTVRTMSSSLLHVLDAIADQHGALIWHVTYTLAVAAPMTSNSTNRIGFVMFDGWGVFIDECIPVTR